MRGKTRTTSLTLAHLLSGRGECVAEKEAAPVTTEAQEGR